MSHRMGKPTICIGENKGADQLRSYCNQRLCFRYIDSKIPLLQPLTIFCDCTAWFESDLVVTQIVGFLTHRLISEIPAVSLSCKLNEQRREKTGLRGFRQGLTQTDLYSHRSGLEAGNFGYKKKRKCTKCRENKGADQLRGYREADLRLCFRIGENPFFSVMQAKS